jgi:Kelch motif
VETGWERAADAPEQLTEIGAAVFDGRIWTAGGFTGDGSPTTTVLVYDPVRDSWDRGPDLPAAVHHPALAGGDRLDLLGGHAEHSPTADVWVLDGQSWTRGPSLPSPRAAGAAAWDGTRLVYAGGVLAEGQPRAEVFALENGSWRPVGALSEAREHLGAASDGAGRVWFLGGRKGGLDTNLGTVDLVRGDQVSPIGALPTPRGGVAGFYARDRACLVGGENPRDTHSEVECVNERGETTTLSRLGHARHGLGAVAIGDTAYVLLGGGKPGLAVSATVERLKIG